MTVINHGYHYCIKITQRYKITEKGYYDVYDFKLNFMTSKDLLLQLFPDHLQITWYNYYY